jgi:divalent metal cation (Fe/Co/Zn/Cd) transporter
VYKHSQNEMSTGDEKGDFWMDNNVVTRMAGLTIISNIFIIFMKLIIGMLTGSVAVFADAMYSLVNAAEAAITFLSIRPIGTSSDQMRKIVAMIGRVLVFVAGLWIVIEAVQEILHPGPVWLPIVGTVVMVASAAISYSLGKTVQNMNEQHSLNAIVADSARLITNSYTSLVVAIGLLLINLTKLYVIDSVVAIALIIFVTMKAIKIQA